MLNNQCQTCQTTQEPLMLDSQTEQIQQRLGGRVFKWGSDMGSLEFYNCKPCWVRGVDQAEKIAFENYKDVSELGYETRYRYLKQGLGRVKELLGK